ALGWLTTAGGYNSTAIGSAASSSGENSVAIGADSEAVADDSVAIGQGSYNDRANTVSVGDVGSERQITNVAAGTEDTDAVNVAQLNEVSDTVGTLADSAVLYDAADKGTVTFGGQNGTVLANVAAGEVSATSTEAVNGSQLFETNTRVGVVEGRVDDLDDRVGDIEGVAANAVAYDDAERGTVTLDGVDGTTISNLAAGSIGAGSTDAINGGQLYGSLDSIATALGGGTYVGATGGLVGTTYVVQGGSYFNVGDALAAIDQSLSSIETRLTTVESAPPANATDPRVAVGGNEAGGDAATIGAGTDAVAIGSNATANANGGVAVGSGAYAHGANDTAIGAGAHVGADGSTAVGANTNISAAATNSVALGEGASVTAASGTALGQGASVTAENAVALGQGSVADRANTVSVGSAGNERAITNVANGTAATDATNLGQVQAGDAATLAAANTYTNTTATQTLTSANAYTDARFAAMDDNFENFRSETDRRFLDQDRRIDRQGAMSSAMLNMATSTAGIRTDNRVGVGIGFQGGEKALSIGYQRALSDRATITVGGAFSGDEKSVGVGAGFGW
ncbi:MAG: hypothetical protein EOP91_08500, partial [Lysobacteraceae bacterium]